MRGKGEKEGKGKEQEKAKRKQTKKKRVDECKNYPAAREYFPCNLLTLP